jgi:hypothetical protein
MALLAAPGVLINTFLLGLALKVRMASCPLALQVLVHPVSLPFLVLRILIRVSKASSLHVLGCRSF